MKILVIEHEFDTPPGSTLEWLQKKNISYEVLSAPHVTAYPSVTEFDGLIICGGSMNVDEEATEPWLVAEKKFIKDSIAAKKKSWACVWVVSF